MAKRKKWIAKAIKRPGALRRKAKRAGKTVEEYCRTLSPKASTRTKRQCALAKTLKKFARKKRKK